MNNQEKLNKKLAKIEELEAERQSLVEKILDAPDSDREKLSKKRSSLQEEIDLIGMEIQLIENRIIEDQVKERQKMIDGYRSQIAELEKEQKQYIEKLNQAKTIKSENHHKGCYKTAVYNVTLTREIVALVAKDNHDLELYEGLSNLVQAEITQLMKRIRQVEAGEA